MDTTALAPTRRLAQDEKCRARVGFQVRFPEWLDDKVREAAADAGMTKNAWICFVARAAVGMNSKPKETA